MTEQQLNILIKAKDAASAVARRVSLSLTSIKNAAAAAASDGAQKMNAAFGATANILKTGFAVGGTSAVALLGAVGFGSIKAAGQFEVYRATLTSMLGTQELANQRLKEYGSQKNTKGSSPKYSRCQY